MSDIPPRGYKLADPRPLAAEAPYTFFLPSPAELEAVAPGDLVKLIFEMVPPGKEWGAERMWVTVSDIASDGWKGVLDNIPQEAPLHLGDEVAFERHHIVQIDWKDPASAPPPPEQRTYWERCWVDTCVLEGTEPVEYLYRVVPDMDDEDDEFPDSGWRIHGRQGDASEEEIEARRAAYAAIGAVLNRDDSWLHLVDAPVGSTFLRDFKTGDYVPK